LALGPGRAVLICGPLARIASMTAMMMSPKVRKA
jgi:hypothetical protein